MIGVPGAEVLGEGLLGLVRLLVDGVGNAFLRYGIGNKGKELVDLHMGETRSETTIEPKDAPLWEACQVRN